MNGLAQATDCAGHLVLYGVSWSTYTQLMDLFADQRLRHSYNDGTLEMMSPLKRHDQRKSLLGRLLESLSLELNIPIQSIGSTTLRQESRAKGLEPDECYYIAHEAQVRDKPDYDPDRDPPPDLAIEVDVTHTSLSRLEIYASLGVPEVWRHDGLRLTFLQLNAEKGEYVESPTSAAFPILSASVLQQFLDRQGTVDETSLVRSFLDWVRMNHPGKFS